MTAKDIRAKRAAAGITGQAICQVVGISRAEFSDIESEYANAAPDELRRIDDAIEQILRTRRDLAKLAAEAGLSLTGVRL